jgi:hypothetical protein
MTLRRLSSVAALSLALALISGAGDPSPSPRPPPDFKLEVAVYGSGTERFGSAQIVVRRGAAYQFIDEEPDEVQVFDFDRSRVILLNLKREVQTAFDSDQLDEFLVRLRRSIYSAIERREKSDRRADQVQVSMSRDLIEPRFEVRYDPAARRIQMKNPTVEIDAGGEPEPDAARLSLIRNCLLATAKLASLRSPAGIPPYTNIDALERLTSTHHLRPTEVSILYRLTGPPQRLRWTFRLVPELTERECRAVEIVERLRKETPVIPYSSFDKKGQ